MKTAFAITIVAISVSLGVAAAPAHAGVIAIGNIRKAASADARIISVLWGHHHCWWIRGRRVCRK